MRAKLAFRPVIPLLLAALLQACASAPPPGYACPGTVDGFIPNDATAAEVKHCLGAPNHVDNQADGRYSYTYLLEHGVTATFLFSSAGRLISVTSPAPVTP